MIKVKHTSKFALLALVVAGIGLVIFSGRGTAQNEAQEVTPLRIPPPLAQTNTQEPITIRKQNGEALYFNVELALTPTQQAKGLMHRTEMAEDAGMLFVFNSIQKLSFWMKNTLIPLDMLFLHPDGSIHHIHHNAKPQDETSITSEFPSKALLELNGGTADKMGIKEGDQVVHRFFNNTGVPE